MTDHHEGKCIHMPGGGWITLGGTQREIVVNGVTYYLEMHHYCGPMRLTKSGMSHQQGFPQLVMDAVQLWIDQGKRMDGNVCVWEIEG